MPTAPTDMLSQFFNLQAQSLTPTLVLASMGLTLLLSLLVAITYQYTFRGFTYSRSFIQSLVLGSVVTCMLVMAIGSNVARGLGILGTLTIIRFRSPVRDARDAVFLLASLGSGIACGAGGYFVSTVGVVFFAFTAVLLHIVPFASRREYEGMLRFSMKVGDREGEAALQDVLTRYCVSYTLLGVCDCVQGESTEFAYQLRLADPSYQQDLISKMNKSGHFESPTLIFQRNTVEL